MATIMSERSSRYDGLTPWSIKDKMRRSGYTPIAVGLALESLFQKEMIEYFQDENQNGETFTSTRLTDKGAGWLVANQERFQMKIDEDPEAIKPVPVLQTVAWNISTLGTGGPNAPVVWSQPPGKYQDVYGNKSIRATRPVIVFCQYESWAILYAWSGHGVSKIWLSD